MDKLFRGLDFVLACILFLFGGITFVFGWLFGYIAVGFSWVSEAMFTLAMRTVIQRWPEAERKAAEKEIEDLDNA